MTAEELQRSYDAGAPPMVLDVRSRPEYAAGHLPGSRHLPFWKVLTCREELRAERRLLLLCCEHGPRAWLAGWVLRIAGVSRLAYLQGHMARWKREGRPLERSVA